MALRPQFKGQAQSQNEQSNNDQPTANVNGQEVPIFGQLDNNQLALVDLETLMRLADMLPKADIRNILDKHVKSVEMLDKALYSGDIQKEEGMAQFVDLLSSELRFHTTVNQITMFKPFPHED